MKIIVFIFVVLITTAFLNACSLQSLNDYKDETPQLKLEEYFNGRVTGVASFFDWAGRINTRFELTIDGSFDGKVLTLDEEILYTSGSRTGEKERRVWRITKLDEENYVGTTDDVVGQAEIKIAGNAARWQYTFNIKADGKVYSVKFDDWMYLQGDGVLLNRAKGSKFGLPVGELFISMFKGPKK